MFGKRGLNNVSDSSADAEIQQGNQSTNLCIEHTLKILYPLIMKEVDVEKLTSISEEQALLYLYPIIERILKQHRIDLDSEEKKILENRLLDDMFGSGPIESLFSDDNISDILVNAPDKIYIERNGELQLTQVAFQDKEHILNIIARIIARVHRRIDERNPFVDAILNDGSRVNAIIPPAAVDSPCLSIRKFKKQVITLEKMVQQNNISQAIADFLAIAVQCRLNIIMTGGAGAGKTTLLNAISFYIPSTERVVTIEEIPELQLQQQHVVRLVTRPVNVEGEGEITQRDLLRNSLHMRPDRIIIGEVRGAEAFDLLQAVNTGHDGSMCTLHASNPHEVPTRLSNLICLTGYDLTTDSILRQISQAINLVVFISRGRDGKRRITNVTEIAGFKDGAVITQELFHFDFQGQDKEGNIIGEFKSNHNVPLFIKRLEYFGLGEKITELIK
jgi:pilus assembly protein CpaF